LANRPSACLVELGRADENDDYIIFHWEW